MKPAEESNPPRRFVWTFRPGDEIAIGDVTLRFRPKGRVEIKGVTLRSDQSGSVLVSADERQVTIHERPAKDGLDDQTEG